MIEKSVATKEIFRGNVVKLRVDTVLLPNKNQVTREIVEHPGGVAIVAMNSKNEVYMVRQYRRPFDEIVYEIPAGKLNYGEDPRECGLRELKEETGLTAGKFQYLGHFYPTPGFCNEKIHIYLATDLVKGDANLDENEFLEVETVALNKLIDLVMKCEIKDAKTAIGLLKVKLLRG